jgi:uncharacterized protein with von Willebrand factor type A (vWA) domain
MEIAKHGAEELLLGFCRALRAAGLKVTQDRAQTYLRAVSVVEVSNERATYWAGQATLCSSPEDLRTYDQVFTEWFHSDPLETARQAPPRVAAVHQAPLEDDRDSGPDDDADDGPDEVLRAAVSAVEVLRHRDIAELGPADRARLAALFSSLNPRPPRRAAYRRVRWRRGDLDTRATLRRILRNGGEAVDLAWRRRRTRPRRVVLLLDVSGSMGPYADALLRLAHRFAHGWNGGVVEVFTLGTRITRISAAMQLRDVDRAIAAAGATVPDWSGGTRLGETLKAFLDGWGQRGMARGAVVVLASDGWERGGAALLGDQMARLHRLAHRVVWMNPHRGLVGYQPVQQGMAAALPHVDDFVAGHSMSAFADLAEVVANA